MGLFSFQAPRYVPESGKSPAPGPDEGSGPSNTVRSVSLKCEDQNGAHDGGSLGTDTPEQCQPVQHLPKIVACFISGVQSLSELDTSHSVDGDDVFNDPVDARADLGLGGH